MARECASSVVVCDLLSLSRTRTQPVPRVDALGSRMSLLTLIPSLSLCQAPQQSAPPKRSRPLKALDCGAGIGRCTETVLLPLYDRVDVVETSTHFLDKARSCAPSWPGIKDRSKGCRFYQCGLQQVDPASLPKQYGEVVGASDSWEGGYDLIWIQWVLPHLSDEQLVAFLQRCRKALREGEDSYIVVKENAKRVGEQDYFHEEDSSITRFALPAPL